MRNFKCYKALAPIPNMRTEKAAGITGRLSRFSVFNGNNSILRRVLPFAA